MDIIFVNPNSAKEVYQELSADISAIEVPVWSLLLAESCRQKGYSVSILDCDAERLTDAEAIKRIVEQKPRIVAAVTYGQNPNSGTTTFVGTLRLFKKFKTEYPEIKTISIGSYTQALPRSVLVEKSFDFISINEGIYTLHDLLQVTNLDDVSQLEKVRGLGWKDQGFSRLNDNAEIVPTKKMDQEMPGYSWDLLPYKNKPFDLYRAHVWHAEYNDDYRTPFASLYSSLGCYKTCQFCMINSINRTSIKERTTAADSNIMRRWSTEWILKQYEILVEKYGVSTIRLSDELFFVNKHHYLPLLTALIERKYPIRSWAYTRLDSVIDEHLSIFKKSGINWLAPGIEAGNQKIRMEIDKGRFEDVDIRQTIKKIHDSGIWIGANYMVGFENENYKEMEETKALAFELMTENMNVYCASSLPGSPLYYMAKDKGIQFPDTLDGFSFHSYNCLPMSTRYLTAAQVLKFRDDMWHEYFESESYHNLVRRTFGEKAVNFIKNMTKIRLKRKILGDKLDIIP